MQAKVRIPKPATRGMTRNRRRVFRSFDAFEHHAVLPRSSRHPQTLSAPAELTRPKRVQFGNRSAIRTPPMLRRLPEMLSARPLTRADAKDFKQHLLQHVKKTSDVRLFQRLRPGYQVDLHLWEFKLREQLGQVLRQNTRQYRHAHALPHRLQLDRKSTRLNSSH